MILYINTKEKDKTEITIKNGSLVIDQMEAVNKHGSQVLLGLIDRILKKNNLDSSDLTAVEVEIGPGSFTGIRVGVSVAQALGFALNIPVNGQINKILQVKYT